MYCYNMYIYTCRCVSIFTYTYILMTSFLIERPSKDLKANVGYLQVWLAGAILQCPETQREKTTRSKPITSPPEIS